VRISLILLFLTIAKVSAVLGQSFNNYVPLSAQGPIPSDLTTLSSEKFDRAKEQIKGRETEKGHQARQDFLLESSFLIDQVLGSGRVLFNDPVSNYLGALLDTILATEPELRAQIRVYAVRSAIVNSFTTDNGIILVNLGLIAQLESEAQLAFVLCHELAHYTEHHVMNAYVQNEELKEDPEQFDRGGFDEQLLERSRYSKEFEKEADQLGFARFVEGNYGTNGLSNVFEVMRYAHLPFDDVRFDQRFFNREYYRMDESYFLQRVRPVEASESEIPDEDSHPSPTERQQLMDQWLAELPAGRREEGNATSKEFEHIRTISRFELSNLYLKTDRPVMTIYNSYLLLRSFPANAYLEKSIALALYTLSKFKSGGNFGQVHPGFSQIEGESQQVYHLFYRLTPEELCILATGHIWNLKLRYPTDQDLDRISRDLLTDLMMNYHVPGMLERHRPHLGWDQPDTTGIRGKYDRLKEKSKENPKLTMITYSLVDLFENAEFSLMFDSLERTRQGTQPAPFNGPTKLGANKNDLRHWKNHGFALDADKVVLVSPTYAKLDLRKHQRHRFLRSETAKAKFIAQIRQSAHMLSLKTELLDRSELGADQIERFNDMVFLNEWMDKRLMQLDVGMINLDQQRVDDIIERYDTRYFSWTGVINHRESRPFTYWQLLYVLIPPAIPLAIYYMARPNYDTYYYNITFDLESGQPVLVNYNNYRKRDARDLINSSIYDSLWQMKRTRLKTE
jgi:hypothetical protein